MNRADKRIEKTKQLIQNTLTQLMREKDIQSITIKELCDIANINRSTFYSHYEDIYNLYNEIESKVLNEIEAIINESAKENYKNLYVTLTDEVSKNLNVLKILFSDKGKSSFQNKLCQMIERVYLDIWIFEMHKTTIPAEVRYLTAYHAQGCVAIIKLWINSNLSDSSEKISEILKIVNVNVDDI